MLAPLVEALAQMARAFPGLSWLPTTGGTLQQYGIATLWQYLVLVSLPLLGFLALDWLTKPRRPR